MAMVFISKYNNIKRMGGCSSSRVNKIRGKKEFSIDEISVSSQSSPEEDQSREGK
jgi:hypothetical protein